MRRFAFVFVMLLTSSSAHADARQDCDQLSIDACTELIRRNPKDGAAYLHRADAYLSRCEYAQAHADYIKVRELIRFEDTLLFDVDKFAGYDCANSKTRATPKSP